MYDCVAEERRPNRLLLSPTNRGVPPKNAAISTTHIICKLRAIFSIINNTLFFNNILFLTTGQNDILS